MSKNKWLKIVNPVMFVSFAIQAVTGIMMSAHKGSTAIAEMHEHNGILLVFLITAHLYLNWDWVRANFLKKRI